MTDGEVVSLRNHIETLIKHEAETRKEAIREEAEKRRDSAKQVADNLIKQDLENQRHFTTLNGEWGRVKDILAATVPREVYESDAKGHAALHDRDRAESDVWRRSVNDALAEARGATKQQAYVIGAFLTILSIVLRFVPWP